jgi:hypothetical protein
MIGPYDHESPDCLVATTPSRSNESVNTYHEVCQIVVENCLGPLEYPVDQNEELVQLLL